MSVPKMKNKKTKKKWIVFGGILIIGIASGIIVKASQKPVAEENTKLREYPVTRGDIVAGVEGGGKLKLQQENYSFEEDVVLSEILVKEGQSVKAGDPLAVISAEWLESKQKELNENLQKAQTALEEKQKEKNLKKETDNKTWYDTANGSKQKYEASRQQTAADLERLNGTISQKQGQIGEIENKIAEITNSIPEKEDKTNKEEIQLKKQEIESLKQQAAGFRQEIDALILEVNTANSTISTLDLERQKEEEKEAGDYSLNNKTNQLEYEKFDHQIQLLVSDVEKAKKEVENLQKLLEAPNLTAGSDGIVLAVSGSGQGGGEETPPTGEEGGTQGTIPKGTSIVTLGNSAKKQAQIMIPQEEISKLAVGQVVNVEVTAFEEQVYRGKIAELNLKPQEQGDSIYYTAIVDLDETTDLLLDGMTAYAEFILKEKKDVLMLSNKAIKMKDQKQVVSIKQKDGTIKEIEITTGFSDGKVSEILSGLKENDIVVIEG